MVIIEGEVSLIMGESIQCSQNRFELGLNKERGGATGRQALVYINNKIRMSVCLSVCVCVCLCDRYLLLRG